MSIIRLASRMAETGRDDLKVMVQDERGNTFCLHRMTIMDTIVIWLVDGEGMKISDIIKMFGWQKLTIIEII